METFAAWQNPGPKCGLDSVATGWTAYTTPGKQVPETSCFNENKNPVNIRRGQRSQEMTFDYVDATAGIWRTFRTVPGHRYRVVAWSKHVKSPSPVVLTLGLDLAAGQDPASPTVQWSPWADTREDTWVQTTIEFRATGPRVTLFLQAHHPFATAGGATMFDDVRVYDLGA
jgi:hypothetical protein